ncbi:hypothetical protein SAMN04488137_1074 [Fictibacillus solisalsi]|uniref:Integral membrane protein n=1 Tax=Fictibacillus solisalsi TaxID=459525 RepID=A0A1G9UQ94_9BACL|nr:hypothetical protein [Fictibacillus solisalsi]SDM62108.1 hypothetical protein SAMN04488137_1074 [Fictibacillus solisalsi]
MNGKSVDAGLWAGFFSGCVLGLFLLGVQLLTGIRVYTLLTNIDFLPFLLPAFSSEWSQFLVHLLVSCVIGVIALFLGCGLAWGALPVAFSISLFAAFLYFPLTLVSVTTTPAVNDWAAILFWFSGHVLYAVVLGRLIQKKKTP